MYAMPLAGTKLGARVKCFEYKLLLRTCFHFERKTATGCTRARTRAANAHTKRGFENSFPGTEMFVQARNKKKSSTNVLVISCLC